MHPLAWGAALLVPAMLMLKKKEPLVQLLIEGEGDYRTPNGEKTELEGTVADIVEELEEVFPGSSVAVNDDMIIVIGARGNFYVNQLIPTPSGQVVIYQVNPLS